MQTGLHKWQVPVGVLLFNENKVDEMCKILDELHKYVPAKKTHTEITLPDGGTLPHDDYKLYQVLLGGDQLTVARVRGAVAIRSNHENAKDRLEGIVPVVEDWHARQVLMQVRTCPNKYDALQVTNTS